MSIPSRLQGPSEKSFGLGLGASELGSGFAFGPRWMLPSTRIPLLEALSPGGRFRVNDSGFEVAKIEANPIVSKSSFVSCKF